MRSPEAATKEGQLNPREAGDLKNRAELRTQEDVWQAELVAENEVSNLVDRMAKLEETEHSSKHRPHKIN